MKKLMTMPEALGFKPTAIADFTPFSFEKMRVAKFNSYSEHPWLKKSFARLKKSDIEVAHDFIRSTSLLDKSDFIMQVQRMFLYCKNKPKAWKEIMELLTCTASAE